MLLSAGDFLTAINQNWTLSIGSSSIVLVVLLAAIGQGHDGFLEASSGPCSMAGVELRLAEDEVNVMSSSCYRSFIGVLSARVSFVVLQKGHQFSSDYLIQSLR